MRAGAADDDFIGCNPGAVASHMCVSECHFVPALIRLLSDTPGSQARIRPFPDWAARSSATVRPSSVPKRGPSKPRRAARMASRQRLGAAIRLRSESE